MNESSLRPLDLRDVIKSYGWRAVSNINDPIYVFDNPEFPKRQIVIPKKESAADYKEASRRAIMRLSELHKIDWKAIENSVLYARDDVVSYRVTSSRPDDDSLPLEFASELIKGAEMMLLSSACTAIRPQTHYPRLALSEAMELLSRAKLGHTQPGSFIINVSCPVDALDIQPSLVLSEDDTTFVRTTMLTIKNGVRELIDAVETDSLDELVTRVKSSKSPTVSSNLCEAIAKLHDEDLRNNIDLSFKWSPRIALPKGESPNDVISIASEYFERIEQVRRELRSIEKEKQDTYFGTVEQLNGSMGDDGRRSGEVVLGLVLEGQIVRARALLNADDYEKAWHVHYKDQMLVALEGKLHPGRQPRLLSQVEGFRIINPSE
ncbi:hypothetical protein [Pseudomonas oryzihabitans]|uniref:hypothetical protein n=1 Tax=Pseudomonas oryzihabitans TaxID=47885 RepID=UPI003F9C9BAA